VEKWRGREAASAADGERPLFVHHRGDVFDIAPFLEDHPGGVSVITAAVERESDDWLRSRSLGLHWLSYPQHEELAYVAEWLATYRVGCLDEVAAGEADATLERARAARAAGGREAAVRAAAEAALHPDATIHTVIPLTAEVRGRTLWEESEAADGHTPQSALFVRSHHPRDTEPRLSADEHSIRFVCEPDVCGTRREHTFTAAQLADKGEPLTVDAVIACAGNRRAVALATSSEEEGAIAGVAWRHAIGNVAWGGVALLPLLDSLFPEASKPASGRPVHLHVSGDDGPARYESATALTRVPPETVVASTMNGEPLGVDQGGPARVVLPGFAGHTHIKRATEIRLVARDADESEEAANLRLAPPRQSYVARDAEGNAMYTVDRLPDAIADTLAVNRTPENRDRVLVRGYGVVQPGTSPGGAGGVVKVTVDGTPVPTSIAVPERYGWTLWSTVVPCPRTRDCAITVDMTDATGAPLQTRTPWRWNARGLGCATPLPEVVTKD
jgi:sulfite oxidase